MAVNQWVKKQQPNSFEYQLVERRRVDLIGLVNRLISLLVDWEFLEKMAEKYQLEIMPSDLKAMMNKDSRVVINDKVLKFHRHDSRKEVQEKFDLLVDSFIEYRL